MKTSIKDWLFVIAAVTFCVLLSWSMVEMSAGIEESYGQEGASLFWCGLLVGMAIMWTFDR
jgi:hypothetical protein